MKKLSFLTVAICILGLMASSQAATAGLVQLTTTELACITGQTGITFLGGQAGLDLENEIFSFDEMEGMEAFAETGVFCLFEPFLDSATISAVGIHIDTVTGANSGVMMTMENPEAHIAHFHHDLRLGSASGMSDSLGVVGIKGMHVNTTGSVRVRG
ncbi:MAG: hypothetical protein SWH68_00495 [Thermodesulfobacteriota bacterium]|nr:hypothetical protein [Thermodesulfobacteriota bacterium]